MKFQESIVAIVAILAVFSLPVIYALGPILRDLVPLAYLAGGIGAFTLAARHLLRYSHDLRMEELKARAALEAEEREKWREADRLLRHHGSAAGIAERAGLTEEELLRAAEAADRQAKGRRDPPADAREGERA